MTAYCLLTLLPIAALHVSRCSCITTYTSKDANITSVIVTPKGHVIVGGRNMLIKLTRDLSPLREVSTLIPSQCNTSVTCSPMTNASVDNNDVAILTTYTDEFLLFCGTIDAGRCTLYATDNLDKNNSLELSNPSNQPVEAAKLGSDTSAQIVIVNVTNSYCYDTRACIYSAIYFNPSKRITYSFSVRRLDLNSHIIRYASSSSTVYIQPRIHSNITFDFVYGFYNNRRVHFLRNTNDNIAYLSELCIDDHYFRSYIETNVHCDHYVKATSGFVSQTQVRIQDVFFVTFSSDKHPGWVLCAYNVSSLRHAFKDAKKACFEDTHGRRPPWIRGDDVSCTVKEVYMIFTDLRKVMFTDAEGGGEHHFSRQDYDLYDCGERRTNSRIQAAEPISKSAIFKDAENVMTSVVATIQYGHIVAFVGFNNGKLVKLLVDSSLSSTNVLLSLGPDGNRNSAIQRRMAFNQQGDRLYFAYGNKVSMLETNDCSLHTMCQGCLAAVAVCTWCTDGMCHGNREVAPCNQEDHVTQHNLTCPPATISPNSGPLAGGTTLTLHGYFGATRRNSVRVSVQSHSCSIEHISPQRVVCSTSNVSSPLAVPVDVSISFNVATTNTRSRPVPVAGSSVSNQVFYYKEPEVRTISPLVSKLSGNVVLTIAGTDLAIGSSPTVYIGKKICNITNRDTDGISCILPAQNATGGYAVTVNIDNKHMTTTRVMQYIPNPVVQRISPRTVIVGGGIHVTMSGQHMNGVGSSINVSLANISGAIIAEDFGVCQHVSQTKLSCLASPVLDHGDLPMKAVLLFAPGDHVTMSAPDNVSIVSIVTDPRIYPFNHTLLLDVNNPTVTIQGADLVNVEQSEVKVTVGEHRCEIEAYTNGFATCGLKQIIDRTRGVGYSVVVHIGNKKHTVGTARFPPRPLSQVAPSDDRHANTGLVVFSCVMGAAFCILLLVIGMRRLRMGPFKKADDQYNVTFRNGSDALTLDGLSENMTDCSQSRHNTYQERTFLKESADISECRDTESLMFAMDDNTRLALERENLLINKQWLVLGENIGQGNFGCVFKGYLQRSEEKEETVVAVKTLHRNNPKDLDVQLFLKEALIMKDFHHMHVVKLLGVCLGLDSLPFVVLPFMQNGDLLSYLRDESHVPTVKALVLFGVDIADGMHYLAELKFVHRDLAARNCMMDDRLRVKVADFGLSRDVYEKEYYSSCDKTTKLPVKWMAPECLEFGVYSPSSDVWSYGVVLWELLTRGVNPYPTVDNWDILRYLKTRRRMVQPSYCPEEMYDIMRRCWSWEKEERPTFGELTTEIPDMMKRLEHPAGERGKEINIETTYVNFMSQ